MEGMKEEDDMDDDEEENRMVFIGEPWTVETFEGFLSMAKLAVRSDCALFFSSSGG